MGGYNSGRHGGKTCTDDLRRLDVSRLQRDGLLRAGRYFAWTWTCNGESIATINIATEQDRVWLKYRQRVRGDEWKDMHYPVHLERTPCNFGGTRIWWLCPAVGCRRRVSVLYGGAVFACRHCHQLAYRCQREPADDRATRRADKIRVRLGWDAGILNGNGWKPKGMHWSTFQRLQVEHDAFVNVALAGIAAKLGIVGRRLEDIENAITKF